MFDEEVLAKLIALDAKTEPLEIRLATNGCADRIAAMLVQRGCSVVRKSDVPVLVVSREVEKKAEAGNVSEFDYSAEPRARQNL